MIRILTVDDHAIVRNGVRQIFAGRPGTATFGEASNAHEACKQVREQDWDVVLLDITLGDRSGIEVMKELKAIRPKLPVLILSMHSEAQFARRAFKSGAAGYVTKDSSPDELAKAVNKVAHGGKYVSPTFAEMLLMGIDSGVDKEPHEGLSDR